MALLETSGFDTGTIRRALDEYDRMEYKRSIQIGAIFVNTMNLIRDARRLYEANDKLQEVALDLLFFASDVMDEWWTNLVAGGLPISEPPAEWKQRVYELDALVERVRELGIEVPE